MKFGSNVLLLCIAASASVEGKSLRGLQQQQESLQDTLLTDAEIASSSASAAPSIDALSTESTPIAAPDSAIPVHFFVGNDENVPENLGNVESAPFFGSNDGNTSEDLGNVESAPFFGSNAGNSGWWSNRVPSTNSIKGWWSEHSPSANEINGWWSDHTPSKDEIDGWWSQHTPSKDEINGWWSDHTPSKEDVSGWWSKHAPKALRGSSSVADPTLAPSSDDEEPEDPTTFLPPITSSNDDEPTTWLPPISGSNNGGRKVLANPAVQTFTDGHKDGERKTLANPAVVTAKGRKPTRNAGVRKV